MGKKGERLLGCHVSVAGGLEKGIENAEALGVNAIQVHPSPPQRWNSKPYAQDLEQAFLAAWKESGVKKVFFHAIYLINLANPDKQKFHLSKLSLVYYLDLMQRIGGDGVVVHVGSMKDQKEDAAGYEQIIKGINWILNESPGESLLLMEVAAGSGKIIGSRMEELARIFEGVEQQERVGFALDSQHMWASGYDFQNDLQSIVKDIKKYFGLKKVKIIHLNDSKTELGSRRDRHENLGQGLIGKKALSEFINHPALKKIPFVLETPGLKTLETAKDEVEKLKKIAHD